MPDIMTLSDRLDKLAGLLDKMCGEYDMKKFHAICDEFDDEVMCQKLEDEANKEDNHV